LTGFEYKALAASPESIVIGKKAPADAPVMEIQLQARKFEFTPGTIEVPVNTCLRIHIEAVDREHGFQIDSFKMECLKIKPGQPVDVEIYLDKAGEYKFKCCVFCGLGHGHMKGKLIVK
jgi:heme/copper-type cytochrome/quinol oxidase subunit 2